MTARHALDLSLYLVTDTALCGERGVAATVEAAVRGGATAVQVRAKDSSAAEALQLLLAVADACDGHAQVLMNDRVDVFLAARARGAAVHGVHVGQSDLPAVDVRAIVGEAAIVGLTASSLVEVEAANALPADTVDYLGIGVIRATTTKPDHPEPIGVHGFGERRTLSRFPAVAIGGIGFDDLRPLRNAGADGVAVVSALCASSDPERSARELRAEWER